MSETTSVLFVCLGNICRSPTAQGVFEKHLADAGLSDRVRVDSAGTGDWHVGNRPDPRATEAAAAEGVDLSVQRARQVTSEDFQAFDYILAMDRANFEDLGRIAPQNGRATLQMFLSYARNADTEDVPDPYYGGSAGFARVLELINDASEGLIADLRARHIQ